jgi:hypothetical protein
MYKIDFLLFMFINRKTGSKKTDPVHFMTKRQHPRFSGRGLAENTTITLKKRWRNRHLASLRWARLKNVKPEGKIAVALFSCYRKRCSSFYGPGSCLRQYFLCCCYLLIPLNQFFQHLSISYRPE